MILNPGKGRIDGEHYLPVNPETSTWGWWPNRETPPVLSVDSGAVITVDTLSHEGILEDQGRDPVTFFAARGVERAGVLHDAVEFARDAEHIFGVDGPHVVTGPIEVRGAQPGDLLKVDVLGLAFRVPYGITSNRHGLGALPGELPDGTEPPEALTPGTPQGTVSIFTRVEPGNPDRARAKTRDAGQGSTGKDGDRAPDAGQGSTTPGNTDRARATSRVGGASRDTCTSGVGGAGGARGDSGVAGAIAVLAYSDSDGNARAVRYPIAPFLGMMGVAADTGEPVPTRPPGRHGGNLDIKHLVVGSTLYLPVQTSGAGFAVGDPHFAQGNGEVALTALEGSLRADLRLSVLRGRQARRVGGLIQNPLAETRNHWITVGMHTDLNEAMRAAVREALNFCQSRLKMPRHIAYAYLSCTADFEVTQVVNEIKGIHCLIPKQNLPSQP